MKIWKFLAIAGAVVTVGGAVFIFSRPAAAAAAGKRAFKVSADCLDVEVVSEDDAKSALQSAAIAAFRSTDELAINFIRRAISIATSCPVSDAMKIRGVPGYPLPITVGALASIVGQRSVGEIKDLIASGGVQLSGSEAPEESNEPSQLDALASWLMR